MFKRLLLLFSLLMLVYSCDEDPLQVDVSEVERETKLKRFERAFFETDTNDFESELNRMRKDFNPFFLSNNTLKNWKYQRTNDRQLALYQASEKIFGEMEQWENELDLAMKHYYYYYPHSPTINYYTYISDLDFNYPVLLADSLCFIALDLYLGKDMEVYRHLPQYLAYYRQPKFLVRDCMEAVGQTVVAPMSSADPSLLESMIYYGKLLYFLEATMPWEKDETFMKYRPDQLQYAQKHERNIWAYFIENQVLFSSGTELQKRFIDPAPFSKFGMKADSETPGRIGQWVGWQIVRTFAENNSDYSLQEIMEMNDARKFLSLSGYRPE